MIRQDRDKKIVEILKQSKTIVWKNVRIAQVIDEWTAEVIGSDLEIPVGTTATAPTRSLPGNPANEHMFAFEDGFNKRGAEARKRAGLPEKP